jgi:hypothetical protein
VFEKALRARDEQASRPVVRVTKKPSRIRPTTKVKGWFRCHEAMYGPIWIFLPKDEDGFSDEPVFVMPDLAKELRNATLTSCVVKLAGRTIAIGFFFGATDSVIPLTELRCWAEAG